MSDFAEKYRLGISWIIGLVFAVLVVFSTTPYDGSGLYEFFEYFGYVLLVVATLGRIWATIYIGGRKDEELLCDGPYSVVRNPLYIFSFLGAIGIIVSAGKLVLLFVVMPFFIYNYFFVIKSEEARLLRLFGGAYASYREKVNSVIPSFRNYWSRNSFVIYPTVFFRSMVHASFFIWLFLLLEFLEYAKESTKAMSILHLPF